MEAVLHSCSEALRKIFPQESRASPISPSRKHETLQHGEHGQKRSDFFQIGILAISEFDLQDSDIIYDPRRLGKISEQIGHPEAVGEISGSWGDDDVVEPISLDDMRENRVGLRACKEGIWM